MFEGTIDSNFTAPASSDGQLSSKFSFPCIVGFLETSSAHSSEIDSTIDCSVDPNSGYPELYTELHEAFAFAAHAFEDLDRTKLLRAYNEAKILAASQLFAAEMQPTISVDPYGEFIFSCRSEAGYVDIGLRGEGELSYHVRNDVEPHLTQFDDYNWQEYHVPRELFDAIQSLRRHL